MVRSDRAPLSRKFMLSRANFAWLAVVSVEDEHIPFVVAYLAPIVNSWCASRCVAEDQVKTARIC